MQIAFFSILISPNVAEHIEEGLVVVPMYFHMPLQMGIPCLLGIVLMTKKKLQK
jgi:spore germination protein KB